MNSMQSKETNISEPMYHSRKLLMFICPSIVRLYIQIFLENTSANICYELSHKAKEYIMLVWQEIFDHHTNLQIFEPVFMQIFANVIAHLVTVYFVMYYYFWQIFMKIRFFYFNHKFYKLFKINLRQLTLNIN